MTPSDLSSRALEATLTMKRYGRMQFADACVARLSEIVPDALVYTTDRRDFAIYRRRGRELIKTVMPE